MNLRICGLIRRHGCIVEAQMDRPSARLGEAVGDKFVLAGHMLDVSCVHRDGRELMLLSTRPWLRRLGHGKFQRLVADERRELPAL